MFTDDPFLEVKEDVEKAVRKINFLYKEFKDILSKNATEAEITRISQDIRTLLRTTDEDLNDLEDTIKVVQANPSTYNLDKTEVEKRKDFVYSTKRTMQEIRNAVNNPNVTRQGGEQGMRNALLGPAKEKFANFDQQNNVTNQKFIENQQQQQTMIMRDQDNELEAVHGTVKNLKEIATVMGNELDEQSRLIDNVELRVDSTSNNLNSGLRRVKDFINANADSKQQLCIAVLIIILIILIILLFTF